MSKPQWESVDRYGDTLRIEVPGGWLYRHLGNALCFVPKPPSAGPSAMTTANIPTPASELQEVRDRWFALTEGWVEVLADNTGWVILLQSDTIMPFGCQRRHTGPGLHEALQVVCLTLNYIERKAYEGVN